MSPLCGMGVHVRMKNFSSKTTMPRDMLFFCFFFIKDTLTIQDENFSRHANLSFYCVNSSYPMDNCFTGRRNWSRQMTEKVILYKLPAGGYIRQVSPHVYFLSRQDDVIASFSFGAWSVQTCFAESVSTRSIFKTTSNFHFIFNYKELLLLLE